MLNERSCFICTTPYQVLTSIALVKNHNLSADLYVVNQFDNSKELSSRLAKEKVFENVYYLDEKNILYKIKHSKSKLMNRLNLALAYRKLDNIIEPIIRSHMYDACYISSKAFLGRLICLYLYKKNDKVKCFYFDDGIGSYCNINLYNVNPIDKIARFLFISPKTLRIHFDKYLYNVELYNKMIDNNESLHTIHPLKNDKENRELISRIFSMNDYQTIKEKFLIFDSLREKELTEKGQAEVKLLFDNIIKIVGQENVIIKAHPRDKNRDKDLNYFVEQNIPFESFCFFQNFSDKVFITNMSTAVFTPKLLFDQEPIVIMLFSILEDDLIIKTKIREIAINFKSIYKKRENVIIPESIDELINVLNELNERGKHERRK